ncbi:hypothetical protein HOD38_01260 [archaeon]|jgi:hypothetical protein|nr:hypothetical protein [archaeon]MBT4396873.1 hypothetical protein [archaeon]MBT4441449.1 hypothetical protein [archaeon]
MKLEKGLIILVFILLIVPFVMAVDGCCKEKTTGMYCVYTDDGACSSAPDEFYSSPCNETTVCAIGCCVSADGVCSKGVPDYTCTQAGGTWSSDEECTTTACSKGCCQFGNEYSFTTEPNCYATYDAYEETPVWNNGVTTEEACNLYNNLDAMGCCVSETGCTYLTGDECLMERGSLSTDTATGYGYYEGKSCADIQKELESGTYTASCNCVYTQEDCTIDHEFYETNTCGDIMLTGDSCSYPSQACYVNEDLEATCRSTACSDTFEFKVGDTITQELQDSADFEMLNSYTVYNNKKGDFEIFELGKTRNNLDSWCVYEGPTGSFRDRIGTQHYRAYCVDGEEVWENCGDLREEYCAMSFDENGNPDAKCISNNFEEYYTYPYHSGKWCSTSGSCSTTPDYNDAKDSWSEWSINYDNRFGEFYGEINQPIKSTEDWTYLYGVSTVPLGTYREDWTTTADDYCHAATFTIDYGFWDQGGGSDEEGYELITNAIGLRSEFIATSMDYCSSRGDCGINLNILGEEGQPDSFDITYNQEEIAGENSDASLGLGECFDLEDDHCSQAESYLQGTSFYSLYHSSRIPGASACMKASAANIRRYYVPILKNEGDLEINTVNDNFLSDFMFPSFLPLSRLYMYSAYNCYTTGGVDRLSKNLGLNYVEGSSAKENMAAYGLVTSNDIQRPYEQDGKSYLGGEVHSAKQEVGAIDGCMYDYIYDYSSSSDYDDDYLDYYTDAIETSYVCTEDAYKVSKEELLYNQLKSIKPWVMNTRSLRATSFGFDYASQYSNPLTFYEYEWEDNIHEGDNKKAARSVHWCEAWEPQDNGDNCHLCDLPSEEGGLWFSKDGKRIDGAACTASKCTSLGSYCKFIEGNRGSINHPSCVSEECILNESVQISQYDDALIDSTATSPLTIEIQKRTTNNPGYDATNIPPGYKVSFGVETNIVSRCKFVEDWRVQEILDQHEGVSTLGQLAAAYTDPEERYNLFMNPGVYEVPDWAVDAYEFKHNISYVFSNGEEKSFYVWCEDICGKTDDGIFEIGLKASEQDPTTYPGTYIHFDPASEQYAPSTAETITLQTYTDVPATCKYSSLESDNFDLMENDMDTCISPSANIIQGDYYCRDEISITDGPNNFYFLCQDQYGNVMSSSSPWTVTKSDPLLITQTSPEGIVSYKEIDLQVRTQAGAEAGKSVCYYKQSNQYTYDQMSESQDSDTLWVQSQTLTEGDYVYDIYCEDVAGNRNETQISFTMDVDEYPPEVDSLFYLSNMVYIITNEETTCEYEVSSFTFGSGFETTGSETTDHTFSVSPGISEYYVICEDEFGNQNSPLIVSLDYIL